MTLVDWLVVMLIVAPAAPALAALILARHVVSESPALRERSLIALRDWAVASIAAALAMARLGYFAIPRDTSLLLLATAMLLVSLPSIYWLWLYFRGRFRGSPL